MSEFTSDWCTGHEGDWKEVLKPYVGQSGVRFVEVGSYEGRSACWFAQNILTGPDSQILCVDPWAPYPNRPDDDMDAVEARFDANAAAYPQIVKFKGCLPDAFGRLRLTGRVDAIYIDGSHSAHDVLLDAAFAWCLLGPGGLMMFDDYSWVPEDKSDNSPAISIDAFLAVMKLDGRGEVVRSAKDLIVIRRLK